MRGDKDTLAAGLLVVASTTISCAAQQNLPAPRVMPESTAPAAELPVRDQNVDVVARLEASAAGRQTGGNSDPGCCNGRLTLRERFRAWKLRHQEAWWGYPDEFHERPLGSAVHETVDKQRSNGEAALMVLHHQDFGSGPEQGELNARGREELRKVAELLPKSFAPVIIERSADARLDERRRQTVIAELNNGKFPVPDERVIIGPDVAFGVGGVEAGLIGINLLHQTEARGRGLGTVGAAISTMTTTSNQPPGALAR